MLTSFKEAYFKAYRKEISDDEADEMGTALLDHMVFVGQILEKNRSKLPQKFDSHLASDDPNHSTEDARG